MKKTVDFKQEKKILRKEILKCRNEMPLIMREEKSEKIQQKVYQLPAYQEAPILLAYADYQSEVITTPIIKSALADGKEVYCPTVQGNDMEFYQINNLGELQEGYKGIREPLPEPERKFYLEKAADNKILMLMPGAVFDTKRHRIGYGKGFYDRYLSRIGKITEDLLPLPNNPVVCTAALAFACQIVEKLPAEQHDICPDILLTEEASYSKS